MGAHCFFDATGTYDLAFLFLLAASGVALALSLTIGHPKFTATR